MISMVDTTKHAAFTGQSADDKWVLRIFDMFDGWVGGWTVMSAEEALAEWNKKTNNGTKNTCFADGDCWHIFPADTRMLMTPEFLGR
tara:strand:- start:66 stop:326 length:261 start_codon:yes stop_codon:yes gene_type:complete